jgi:hypothetical protein
MQPVTEAKAGMIFLAHFQIHECTPKINFFLVDVLGSDGTGNESKNVNNSAAASTQRGETAGCVVVLQAVVCIKKYENPL